jgi:hypothetical protein
LPELENEEKDVAPEDAATVIGYYSPEKPAP